MKKFKFRLDRVANIKNKQVKQKTNELANLIQKQEEAKSALKGLKEDLDATQKEIVKRSSQGCPVREVLDYQRYLDKLTLKIQKKNKEIESFEENIEKLQVDLLELNKEKKVLEKLKEKRHLQYIVEQNREEQKQLDEVFNLNKEIRKIL